MNIIIPLGGKGERFKNNGYNKPKPLITIFEKNMIEYVIDNINITEEDTIFIIYNKSLDTHDFCDIISAKYPSIKFIKVDDTKGAAETLFIGIHDIFRNCQYHSKSIILDCDTFYTEDIITIFRQSNDNMVFYTKNYDDRAIYSYIDLDAELTITNIKEKIKITDNANTGAYAFTDIHTLHKFCKHVLDNNITFNNEPYTSCVISAMIQDGIIFKGVELNDKYVFSLGTPNAVSKYIQHAHAFLFDLDGTLVMTDKLYFNIWHQILHNYNIELTDEMFANIIQGNNDHYVVNTLLSNVNSNVTVNEISKIKDQLFIEKIATIQIIDGVREMLTHVKLEGHKCCIVTNCNRIVAEKIIQTINIGHLVDFIISNNDCKLAKPYAEPYLNAINKYNIANNKCFIFEDSKSGLLSGRSVSPKMLIGIETIYNSTELAHYGANRTIKNYTNFDFNNLFKCSLPNYLINLITTHLHLQDADAANATKYDINAVIIDKNKLKGGFIADVIEFKINTKDNNCYSFILKYENTEINNLSIMAKQLQLYSREYYFYQEISASVNIKIPKFISLIKQGEGNTHNACGIILENLFVKHYKNNLNLNNEKMDVSLKIVDRMAQLHSQFWNKNLKEMFPELKKCDDPIFCPFLTDFIADRRELFIQTWRNHLNCGQIVHCHKMFENFAKTQQKLSSGANLTFIHGDIKSPNIFYDIENQCEPYFIDWQHCAIGKGVQDLIFFIIESFDIHRIPQIYNLLKPRYFQKILEYGIVDYSIEDYENDIRQAISYIPFFTAVWFGTVPQDELIDKDFPHLFIKKLFNLIEFINNANY
jgi:beta-phosphoglucomutase-like phosphatase (HAD superfamily)/molybdopterin-guanine dinucleotide biosynthesis protein A